MININSIVQPGDVKCLRLTNADGKSWLLPTRNISVALELYQPSGAKGKLMKRILPFCHGFSPVMRVIRAKKDQVGLSKDILSVAEHAFKVSNLEYSVFGGTPSVHQKITIQFFKNGKILGYGKVSDNEDVENLFFHEQNLLDELKSRGISDIPDCLFCDKLPCGLSLFIQSTVKSRKSCSPHDWTDLHEEFLTDMSDKSIRRIRFENSDFGESLIGLKDNIDFIPEEYRSVVLQSLNNVLDSNYGKMVDYSAFHADFTPWNMFIEKDRLYVFDWEYGKMTYPPMLDKYHFFIQQAIHVGHLSSDGILKRIKAQPWYDGRMLRYYLLDIISRFTLRENGNVSSNLKSMLDIWVQMLK